MYKRQVIVTPISALDEIELALHRMVPPGDLARNHPGGALEGLQSVFPVVVSADAKPTRQARDSFTRWQQQAEEAINRFTKLSSTK